MNVEDYQELNSFNSILTMNFLWIFFGLVTNSWKFFLVLLIVNLLLNILINKTTKIKTLNYLIGFLKIITVTSAVGTLVINHFHLHLDLFGILKDILF